VTDEILPLPWMNRSCLQLQGKLFTNKQSVFFFFLLLLFLGNTWSSEEDGNVILRAIFKFSGIDWHY
jgi:hypothetical protein